MTLSFMRNKVVEVEPLPENVLSVKWRLVDNLTEAEVNLKVRLPDLEITEAEARLDRSPHSECAKAPPTIKKIIGVRIGAGLRKIVEGLVGGPKGCSEFAEGILECCNAVILHFTVPQIKTTEKGSEEEKKKAFQDMLKFNPRLVRSCIAFADNSPMMEGLEL